MNQTLRAHILTIVTKIPPGKLMTYATLAKAAGMPRAHRYIGTVLGSNDLLITIPCHRVVRTDGSLGGYKNGVKQKTDLLRIEQIEVARGRVINLKKYLFSV